MKTGSQFPADKDGAARRSLGEPALLWARLVRHLPGNCVTQHTVGSPECHISSGVSLVYRANSCAPRTPKPALSGIPLLLHPPSALSRRLSFSMTQRLDCTREILAVARRQLPGPMERPSISDAEGYPVVVDRLPSEADHAGWEVVTSPATDREGWQYGSVFRCEDFTPLLVRRTYSLAWMRGSIVIDHRGVTEIHRGLGRRHNRRREMRAKALQGKPHGATEIVQKARQGIECEVGFRARGCRAMHGGLEASCRRIGLLRSAVHCLAALGLRPLKPGVSPKKREN